MKWSTIMFVTLGLGLSMLSATAGEDWLTDFEQAKKEATEKKLPILADFSGSDWCGWCIKLDKEVFSQPAFKAYAKNSLVLFIADFPRKKKQAAELKKQNKDLATTYAIRGYPTVLLLDAAGKELARTGYQEGGAEAYVEHLKKMLKEQKPATEAPVK
ncbi:MAG: thioredoxin family protein [Kiritimatiellae bacterium]|nr:thioredoxin family protein [Kiritimatiellia bacterium]